MDPGIRQALRPVLTRMVALAAVSLVCWSPCLNAQDRKACDTDILAQTETHLGRLGPDEWGAFFGAIAPRCKADEGFMGWMNDLLYRSLESQPSEFMEAFDNLPRITQRLILDELGAPRHPGLDAARTYEALREIQAPAESKQRILHALTKAGCRCETEIVR